MGNKGAPSTLNHEPSKSSWHQARQRLDKRTRAHSFRTTGLGHRLPFDMAGRSADRPPHPGSHSQCELGRSGLPTLVAGDFNNTPNSRVVEWLPEKGKL